MKEDKKLNTTKSNLDSKKDINKKIQINAEGIYGRFFWSCIKGRLCI